MANIDHIDRIYYKLVESIISANQTKLNEISGKKVYSLLGPQLRTSAKPFPILTTKYVNYSTIFQDLFTYLELEELGNYFLYLKSVSEDTFNESVEQGKIVDYRKVNPIYSTLELIKEDPFNPRIGLSVLTSSAVDGHFIVDSDEIKTNLPKYVNLIVNFHTVDVANELPKLLVFYGALLNLVAQFTNLQPRQLIFNFVQLQLDANHISSIKLQMQKINQVYNQPNLFIVQSKEITDLKPTDLTISHYSYHDPITFN